MDIVDGLVLGFGTALSLENLAFVLLGVTVGMVIGVLPGLGPTATIALLLPLTYGLEAPTAIMMLAGVYYGSMYGGTITAVLLNIPGEASSVVTAVDGNQMARNGRAGPAIGTAAIASAVGGVVSAVGLVLLAPPAAALALEIGPADLTVIAALGIVLAAYLGTKSFVKSLAAATVGLVAAAIGQDPMTGVPRLAFGSPDMTSGLEFAAVAMGLFGIGEMLYNLNRHSSGFSLTSVVGRALPSLTDLRRSRGPIARGSVIGFVLGLLPGGGGLIPPLASYAVEKRMAARRARTDPTQQPLGTGAIQGVAGPETANNAGANAAFVPLLTLGLPTSSVLALMFGALMIQGVTPGPGLVSDEPALFWGVIASMFVGNLMLLLMNIPLVRAFVQLLRVPLWALAPITIIITLIGVFSLRNNVFDMYVAIAFGLIGYFMRKAGFEPGPLVLAFILGPIFETSLRQTLRLSDGELSVFVSRPVSGVLLVVLVGILLAAIVRGLRTRLRRTVTSGAAPNDHSHQRGHEGRGDQ